MVLAASTGCFVSEEDIGESRISFSASGARCSAVRSKRTELGPLCESRSFLSTRFFRTQKETKLGHDCRVLLRWRKNPGAFFRRCRLMLYERKIAPRPRRLFVRFSFSRPRGWLHHRRAPGGGADRAFSFCAAGGEQSPRRGQD